MIRKLRFSTKLAILPPQVFSDVLHVCELCVCAPVSVEGPQLAAAVPLLPLVHLSPGSVLLPRGHVHLLMVLTQTVPREEKGPITHALPSLPPGTMHWLLLLWLLSYTSTLSTEGELLTVWVHHYGGFGEQLTLHIHSLQKVVKRLFVV